MSENALTEKIIGAAIEVHRHWGPGLLESTYEECLCYELALAGLSFQRQERLPVRYKGLSLDCGYKMDLVVENAVVVNVEILKAGIRRVVNHYSGPAIASASSSAPSRLRDELEPAPQETV
jgi:GxxExxY protein